MNLVYICKMYAINEYYCLFAYCSMYSTTSIQCSYIALMITLPLVASYHYNGYQVVTMCMDWPVNRYTTHNMDNLIHYYTIQVIPILVEDCQSLRDCTSCAASDDPLCGWCSIEKKCSRRNECINNTETRRWIQEEDMCIPNLVISPNILAVEMTGF